MFRVSAPIIRCGDAAGLHRIRNPAMDLRHLRTLPTIAELGRFGAAARAIGLSQSAVSLHIGALEGGLGTVLFDRRHRPASG